ncbi:MAG: TolC family protein [Chitinophagaceae bacterium]|nr:MAG: TolC family protein [Chitinophagaceae bacterium]
MILRLLFLSVFSITACLAANSQEVEKWDLKKCIDYGMEHNISVKQADVQARISALTLSQSRQGLYPSVNVQNNAGYQFGRSIDPVTNEFTNEKFLSANHSLNANVDLFNWFSKTNTVAANAYAAEAARAGIEKAKNDIALNIANAYLQILLNAEQIRISEVQVQQSIEQVRTVGIQVNAGALPELNLAELETQLANDSSTLITANSNYVLSVLQLKAVLNIGADAPFDVAIPPVESIPIDPLSELDPASVYKLAEVNMPQQQINLLNLKSAQKNVLALKGRLYPTLGLFGGLDTRYSNRTFPGFTSNSYFKQVNDNFSQSVGVALNIPIFNGGVAKTNLYRGRLNVTSVELQTELDAQTLKQDIWQAHTNAVAALQKFHASQKGVVSSQKAYDFAKARFDIGLLNSLDLITNQNNLFRAKINLVLAQYDYVFKMKLLEFYKGQGLKL